MARASTFEGKHELVLLGHDASTATVQDGTGKDARVLTVDLATGSAAEQTGVAMRAHHGDRSLVEQKARARWADAQRAGVAASEVPIGCAPIQGGVIVVVHDEDDGPWTTVRAGGEGIALPGEAMSVASSAGGLAVLRTDRGVFVVDLARQLTLASFGVSREDAVALAAAADVAIVLAGATLLVCTADGRMTRLPFAASPDARGYVSSSLLAVGERFFVVVVDEHLYAIDRSTVAFGAPGTEQRDGLTMVARADARSDDEVCVVRASLARFVALTHVRHQTHFNHPMDSPEIASTFVKGERVYVRGAALIRERELAASETALAEEHLEASALGALEPVAMPRADQSAERGESVSFARGLAAVAEAIGLRPTPLLDRFTTRYENDSFLREVAYRVLHELAPSVRPDAGVFVDPCPVLLADEGNGDWHGFYDYPPARGEGHGVVCYLHEENRFEWVAASFDGYVASALRAALEIRDEELAIAACRLLRMLNLPITFLDEHPPAPPPAWFLAAHAENVPYRAPDALTTMATADADGERGDWIAAERAYVRALHETLDDAVRDGLAARLGEAYRHLGWPRHAQLSQA